MATKAEAMARRLYGALENLFASEPEDYEFPSDKEIDRFNRARERCYKALDAYRKWVKPRG